MRRGETTVIAAVLVAGVGALASAGAFGAERLAPGLVEPGTWPAAGALAAGACAAALLVAGGLWGATVSRLAARVREWDGSPGSPAPRLPGVLGAFGDEVSGLGRRLGGRADELTARLREMDIRRSLTEAERDHARAILDSLRDAVLVTDSFNELTIANERAASLLGFEIGEAAHRPVDEILGDERLRRLIKDARSAGVVSKQKCVEWSSDDPGDGGQSEFDVTVACLPDAQSGVGGVVTILRDVTREREISQMKSDFVSQASHELRTPLSSINAYAEMLIDGDAEDEKSRMEAYQIIKSEAERVGRMIDNMLNISRIEAGIHAVEPAECDFVAVCREVIETMQPQARSKQIKLALKSGPLVYTAEADRDMIYQVVMNLVSNAIKYTPEGGRVTVSVENDDTSRSVMVSVADTGLGIPPDALGRVFDKFYRIENYKRVAKGTGLGLNLVKHIVETVHSGAVGVTSEMGMGSRFWFTVPYESPRGG